MSAQPQVYYNKPRAVSFWIGSAFVVLVAIDVIVNPGHGTVADKLGGAVAFVLGLTLLVRCARCVVVAEADALVVRNPLRSYRIPWAEITHIYQTGYSYGSGSAAGTGYIVAFTRRHGRTVKASALITYMKRSHGKTETYADHAVSELFERIKGANADAVPWREGNSPAELIERYAPKVKRKTRG